MLQSQHGLVANVWQALIWCWRCLGVVHNRGDMFNCCVGFLFGVRKAWPGLFCTPLQTADPFGSRFGGWCRHTNIHKSSLEMVYTSPVFRSFMSLPCLLIRSNETKKCLFTWETNPSFSSSLVSFFSTCPSAMEQRDRLESFIKEQHQATWIEDVLMMIAN